MPNKRTDIKREKTDESNGFLGRFAFVFFLNRKSACKNYFDEFFQTQKKMRNLTEFLEYFEFESFEPKLIFVHGKE